MISHMETPSATLYWKWEDGPPDGDPHDPSAVGPAWVIEANGDERDINGGEWITRAEAIEMAAANGWELNAGDDPDDTLPDAELDVEAVNARLRGLGIDENQLVVLRDEDPPGYVLLGSLASGGIRMPPLSPWESEESRQSVRHSFTDGPSVAARLDKLVPGWRDQE